MSTEPQDTQNETKWIHPEQKEGEVFLHNLDPSSLNEIGWTSKRLGNFAYGSDHMPLKDSPLRPLFISRQEVEQRLQDPNIMGRPVLEKLLR